MVVDIVAGGCTDRGGEGGREGHDDGGLLRSDDDMVSYKVTTTVVVDGVVADALAWLKVVEKFAMTVASDEKVTMVDMVVVVAVAGALLGVWAVGRVRGGRERSRFWFAMR